MDLKVGEFWKTRGGEKSEIIWLDERGKIRAVGFVGEYSVDYYDNGKSAWSASLSKSKCGAKLPAKNPYSKSATQRRFVTCKECLRSLDGC